MRTPVLPLSLLISINLSAQGPEIHGPWCTAHDLGHLEYFHANDPEELGRIAQDEEALELFTQEFGPSISGERNTYVIPIVFHIIHNNGPENISDEQIYDAVRVLNEDFNKLNADWTQTHPDFIDLVADIGIEFRLARKDPQGNCTKGITRTQSTLTNDGTQAMKNLIQWPRNRYLNVWIAASANGAAGYTLIPSSVNNWPAADGIVQLHSYTGSIGTSNVQRSRTLTHEVGHWLNLRHTWGPTNNPGLDSNCDSDDNVADTPNTRGWTSCNVNGISCGTLDNVQNYMDYSYCYRMFTEGQRTRMLAALNSGTAQRSSLWQSSNLTFTGVNGDGALCAASFSSNMQVVCEGSAVQFADESYHNVTSWQWNFPGGDPAVATEPTPNVVYDTPGVFPVSLTVGDGQNTQGLSEDAYIMVLPATGMATPFSDSFEDLQEFPNERWFVRDLQDNVTFQVVNNVAYTGSKSVRLNNFQGAAGDIDELLSTTLDMSGAQSISVTFRYAYARRNADSDDRLKFYVSNNCGQSWSLRRQWRGQTLLSTAPDQSTPFTPNSPSQWALGEVTNISSSHHVSNFRFKFEFESDGGNNFYLDDINVNGMPLSVQDLAAGQGGLLVVPNPAQGMAEVVFHLDQAARTRLSVLDVLGREIATLTEAQLPAGPQRIPLPVQQMQSGVYFVRMQQGAATQVVRFVVQ